MPFEGPLPQVESDVVQLLRAGKARLEAHGWCQRAYIKGKERCALGAIGHHPCYGGLSIVEVRAARALDTAAGCEIAEFNDREKTTLPDVLAVFDRAIAAELARVRATA